MFCTECGQTMADEAKFCAFCGTRRAVAPASASETQAPATPPRVEVRRNCPPAPVRTIRSTAEIMQMRPRPAAPRTPAEEPAERRADRDRCRRPTQIGPRKKARRRQCMWPEPPPPSRVRESRAAACGTVVCRSSCCAPIRVSAVRRRAGIAGRRWRTAEDFAGTDRRDCRCLHCAGWHLLDGSFLHVDRRKVVGASCNHDFSDFGKNGGW